MEKQPRQFNLKDRARSLAPAIHGLSRMMRSEHNSRIHLIAAGIVIIAGFLFHIERIEWLFLIFCIGLVIVTEIINTAVERIVDLVSPQRSEQAGLIKDISAGAVLIASIIALVAGIIIFLPHFF